MGLLGYIENYNLEFNLNKMYTQTLETCFQCLNHGNSWIFTTSSYTFSYNFNLWYFWNFNSFFTETFDFFFLFCWIFNLLENNYQLFFALFLDIYINFSLIKYPNIDEWFNFLLNSKKNSFVLIFHPEFVLLKQMVIKYFSFEYSNVRFVLYNNASHESYDFFLNIYFYYLFLLFISVVFIVIYFSFFTNPFKEENFLDIDYLAASASVEAEKEISSFDDMILTFIVLFYIFGWYFYIHCWSLLFFLPELTFVFYLFPGLYFIIIGIPTFLIWDFGVFFLVYLRGVGNSSLFFLEMMYDYLAVTIFYTRILVQGVRLILMLFTYISMSDVTLFFNFNNFFFLGFEFFWETFYILQAKFETFTYFFFFSLLGTIFYWIYEIFHTYFVVTIQFFAFFAIVFWLFLFLYTFFVIEKQENYFSEKRKNRKLYFSYFKLLKS